MPLYAKAKLIMLSSGSKLPSPISTTAVGVFKANANAATERSSANDKTIFMAQSCICCFKFLYLNIAITDNTNISPLRLKSNKSGLVDTPSPEYMAPSWQVVPKDWIVSAGKNANTPMSIADNNKKRV